jgi:nucleoid-associated protein YgaU
VLRDLAEQVGIPVLKKVVDRAADEALARVFGDEDTTSAEEPNWQIEFALVFQKELAAEPILTELSNQVNITVPTEVVVELGQDSVQRLVEALLLTGRSDTDVEELARLVAEVLADSDRQLVPSGPGASENVVVVRPGDSLWRIAEAALGGRPTAAEVDEFWRRIYRDNRQTIGLDPDLIHPDMRLDLSR